MSEEDYLPPHVKFWLSADSSHDCHFIVGPESGQEKRIGSFKAFLIGYSERFRDMFKNRELTEKEDISIVDIQPDTFTYFLKCLYMNCENITEGKISLQDSVDLLQVADLYVVPYLKEKLVNCILHTLNNDVTLEDIFIALSHPVVLHDKLLGEIIRDIIPSKIMHIFSSFSFFNMSSESLLWILKLEDVGTDEITIWREVLKWATYNTNSIDGTVLRQYMSEHLKYIRFCTISQEEFCKRIVPIDILTHTEVYEICKSVGTGLPPNMEFICNNIIPRHKSEEKPESTYLYCINNVKDLEIEMNSDVFTLQGLQWSIVFEVEDDQVTFLLTCESKTPTANDKHSVTCDFVLVNHRGSDLCRSLTAFYNEEPHLGFEKFCSWNEITNPSKKYILYNSLVLLVRIT